MRFRRLYLGTKQLSIVAALQYRNLLLKHTNTYCTQYAGSAASPILSRPSHLVYSRPLIRSGRAPTGRHFVRTVKRHQHNITSNHPIVRATAFCVPLSLESWLIGIISYRVFAAAIRNCNRKSGQKRMQFVQMWQFDWTITPGVEVRSGY